MELGGPTAGQQPKLNDLWRRKQGPTPWLLISVCRGCALYTLTEILMCGERWFPATWHPVHAGSR